MSMPQISELRDLVTVEALTTSRGSDGSIIETWVTVARPWAKIEFSSGREEDPVEKLQAVATHKITMRYYALLVPEMRIVHGDDVYHIEAVEDIERRHCFSLAHATLVEATSGGQLLDAFVTNTDGDFVTNTSGNYVTTQVASESILNVLNGSGAQVTNTDGDDVITEAA